MASDLFETSESLDTGDPVASADPSESATPAGGADPAESADPAGGADPAEGATPPGCRNCGAALSGPYCSSCGQQDMPLELPFRHMVKEWFGSVFAFDSRLAHTLWPLIRRPGWLTTEYLAGRRVRYVPPLRLYFFISVLMLFAMAWENTALITSSGNSGSNSGSGSSGARVILTHEDGENGLAPEDAVAPSDLTDPKDDPAAPPPAESEAEAEDDDGAFEDFIDRKLVQPYQADPNAFNRKFRNRLGQTLFFLVPMFALLTKLLFRKVRPFYFHHLIFSLHVHAFGFLLLTLDIALPALGLPDSGGLIGLFLMVYIFMALRRFSEQSRRRVFAKFLLLALLYNILLLFTLLGTLALTVVLPS